MRVGAGPSGDATPRVGGRTVELLKQPIVWVVAILGGVLAFWLKRFLNQFLPAPQRVLLAIMNTNKVKSPRPRDRFRIVLCWLENDDSGRDTKTVSEAFLGIGGIEFVRSARIVAAVGAADDWRPVMHKGICKILNKWKADLAIVGSVKKSGEVLNLWFVPRKSYGTLPRGDMPYVLKDVSLQEDFREDLSAQIAIEALRAVAPLADSEVRGQVLDKELIRATKKLEALLKSGTITRPERRAALSLANGDALVTLGERDSGPERLERAVEAYNEALKGYTRERTPLQWAMTQNKLGSAFQALGEGKSGPECLKRAVHAYTKALAVLTRKRAPLDWAMAQNNLGNALRTWGERECGPERLKWAVHALNEALEVFTRERMPLQWAVTQNNLGNALAILGGRESGPERLEQAVHAYTEALKELTRERVPLDWAMAQNNLGNALSTWGERESGPERLKQAVHAYTEALEVFTRKYTPSYWAMAQNNLGHALQTLGQRDGRPEHLEQAVSAYTEALKEYTHERMPRQWAITQNNLNSALMILRERKAESAPDETSD